MRNSSYEHIFLLEQTACQNQIIAKGISKVIASLVQNPRKSFGSILLSMKMKFLKSPQKIEAVMFWSILKLTTLPATSPKNIECSLLELSDKYWSMCPFLQVLRLQGLVGCVVGTWESTRQWSRSGKRLRLPFHQPFYNFSCRPSFHHFLCYNFGSLTRWWSQDSSPPIPSSWRGRAVRREDLWGKRGQEAKPAD